MILAFQTLRHCCRLTLDMRFSHRSLESLRCNCNPLAFCLDIVKHSIPLYSQNTIRETGELLKGFIFYYMYSVGRDYRSTL